MSSYACMADTTQNEKVEHALILTLDQIQFLYQFLIFLIAKNTERSQNEAYEFNRKTVWTLLCDCTQNSHEAIRNGKRVDFLYARLDAINASQPETFDINILLKDRELLQETYPNPARAYKCIQKLARVFHQFDPEKRNMLLLKQPRP